MGACCSSQEIANNVKSQEPVKTKQVFYTVTSGDFSLQIKVNNKTAPLIGDGSPFYFQLADGSEYVISMGNNGPTKCDVKVELDSTYVGLWRVEAGTTLDVERPSGVKQRFTFKSAPQSNRIEDEINPGHPVPENGRISLTFTPEIKKDYNQPSVVVRLTELTDDVKLKGNGGYQHDLDRELYSGGTTTLGRESTQTFNHVSPITEVDKAIVTEIKAWLVINNVY